MSPESSAYTGVMGLDGIVDTNAIVDRANKHIEAIMPSINTGDLGDWRLLMYLVFNHGNAIGIGKRCVSYPSDKERQWSIGISVPDLKQAAYGLGEKHFVRAGVGEPSSMILLTHVSLTIPTCRPASLRTSFEV